MNGASSSYQQGLPDDEAGASDNRLSLSQADFPMIEDWEDGKEYELSALGGAKLVQMSPGEFKVVPGSPAEEGETQQDNETPAEESSEAYPNPAIAKLMGGAKR